GYSRLINHYVNAARSPAGWHTVERFAVHHAQLFAIVQAMGELTLGIMLAVGLVRPVAGFIAGSWLLTLWLSELGLGWIWEFPPIIVGSFAVAVANLPWFLGAPRWRDRLLGPRIGPALPTAPAALLAGLILPGLILAHRHSTIQ